MNKILLCAVFAVTLSVVYGLECYVCGGGDSAVSAGECGDEFQKPKELLDKCNDTETFCFKHKTGINHIYTHVTRGCAETCEENNMAYIDKTVCCQGDGCNHSNNLVFNFFTTCVMIVSACILN